MPAPAAVPASLELPPGGELSCLDTCTTSPGKVPRLDPPPRERNAVLAGYLARDPDRGRWAYHKANGDRLARKLEAAELPDRAARMRACGDVLLYRPEGGLLGAGFYCGQRLCPVCQSRRATTWAHRVRDALPELAGIRGVWVLLTLTMRSVAIGETRAGIRKLHRAVDRLAKRKEWAARGWIRNTEVTAKPSAGTIHPHCHLLLLLPSDYHPRNPARLERSRGGRRRIRPGYMTQKRIRELWARALGVEYDPRVDIRLVRWESEQQRGRAILEVCKYGVKPAELAGLSSSDLATLVEQLASHRTFSVCGELRRHIPPRNDHRQQLERMIRLQKAPGPQEPARQLGAIALWDPKERTYQLVLEPALYLERDAKPGCFGMTPGDPVPRQIGRHWWVTRNPPQLQELSPLAAYSPIGDMWWDPENVGPPDEELEIARRVRERQARARDHYRPKRE